MMNYNDVEKSIKQFVQDALDKLKQGETVVFPEIGKFFYADNALQFSSEGHNYLSDAFGLIALDYYPVMRGVQTPESAKQNMKVTHKAKGKSNRLTIVAAAASVCLVIVLFSFLYRGKNNHVNQASLGPKTLPHLAPSKYQVDDSYQKDETMITATRESKAEEPESEVKPVAVESKPTSKKVEKEPAVKPAPKKETSSTGTAHTIVLGSFKNAANVKDLSRKLGQDGFKTVTEKNGALQKLSIKLNCSDKELSSKLDKIKKKYHVAAFIAK
jgi:cell division septation protein DedD